jgi:hypothetical protein
LEVSESSTSLTGESRSDATDADRSVLANDPTFTSWLLLLGLDAHLSSPADAGASRHRGIFLATIRGVRVAANLQLSYKRRVYLSAEDVRRLADESGYTVRW